METEVTYKGVKLLVEGNYVPGEDEVTYYSDMSGHPSSPSYFEVEAIFAGDVDISDLLTFGDIDDIAELALENIEE
jgi:hypothetical protein